MTKQTGLNIINGLIAGLNEVVVATDAVIAERGERLQISHVLDSRIIDACTWLGKNLSLATAPEREDWLNDVNSRIGQSRSWVQQSVGHVANIGEYQRLHRWGVPGLRKDCTEYAERLTRYEPLVRRGAEDARRSMLALLNE